MDSSPVAINVYLKCIIWGEDKGLKHEKKFVRDDFQLNNKYYREKDDYM